VPAGVPRGAVVFELRRFKDYKEVTIRILTELRDDWRKSGLHPRLATELDLTLDSLSKRRKEWLPIRRT